MADRKPEPGDIGWMIRAPEEIMCSDPTTPPCEPWRVIVVDSGDWCLAACAISEDGVVDEDSDASVTLLGHEIMGFQDQTVYATEAEAWGAYWVAARKYNAYLDALKIEIKEPNDD